MHRLSAIITVILCYIGLFLIIISYVHFSDYKGPESRNGVVDLSHWNFEQKSLVKLNGQWKFYPDQILSPKAVHAGKGGHPMLVTVPEDRLKLNGGKTLNASSGTYRLLIRSDKDQVFGIRTPMIYSSSRIYMNGRLIGGSGRPSNSNHLQSSLKPYTGYFPIHRGTNELIIQFAGSKIIPTQGITKPIDFGTERGIARLHDMTMFNDIIMVASFFMMGLYFLGYYIQRRKDVQLLLFSIFCLLYAVIISWIGQSRLIYFFFPNLSFPFLFPWEILSTILIGIIVLLYLFFAYPKLVSKKLVTGGIALSLFTLVCDFLPGNVLFNLEMILHSFLAISILIYTSYIFVLAVIQKVEGSLYLMAATVSMSFYIIITTISAYSSKNLASLYSISSLVFLLMLSLMMSQRFTAAFNRSESLAQELIENNRMKDEFIAKTSHEFKTPLNGIINITQTLLANKRNRTIQDEKGSLDLITRIGYRLSDLVNDILDLEKMKHGTLNINPVPIDIFSTVKIELPFYKLLADKKDLKVVVQIPPDLPLVLADKNRFRQILNNLIDNAVKYTQKGKILLQAKQIGTTVEVTVTDTGIGIPALEQEMIFQAFRRRNDLSQSEGAGLGLSIVKQLVELQSGKIWVDSKVGAGSSFHFTVPIVDQQRLIASTISAQIQESAAGRDLAEARRESDFTTPYYSQQVDAPTILIVDDNVENLIILLDMLENVPYNVIAVKNGQEALDIVFHSQLDLVILDIMMPGMSGYDVCREIRKQYDLTDLPVLMLTAAIINADKHYAFRAGANDILQKPFNFSEFAARVQGLILMKKAASQATNMEVAFLQSQIKPHFLYNVLNSIIALSYEDVEKSRQMTADFAAYLRGSFDFQNTSSVSSFKKELSLVKSYLAIEKMRFEDRLQVIYDVDDRLDFPLLPLLIQPLIENAVQHGIGKKKAGGQVSLSVHRESRFYIISVSDNGAGMPEEKAHNILTPNNGSSVGLKNVDSRLKHFYGIGLNIESAEGKGTTVSMRIPAE